MISGWLLRALEIENTPTENKDILKFYEDMQVKGFNALTLKQLDLCLSTYLDNKIGRKGISSWIYKASQEEVMSCEILVQDAIPVEEFSRVYHLKVS